MKANRAKKRTEQQWVADGLESARVVDAGLFAKRSISSNWSIAMFASSSRLVRRNTTATADPMVVNGATWTR